MKSSKSAISMKLLLIITVFGPILSGCAPLKSLPGETGDRSQRGQSGKNNGQNPDAGDSDSGKQEDNGTQSEAKPATQGKPSPLPASPRLPSPAPSKPATPPVVPAPKPPAPLPPAPKPPAPPVPAPAPNNGTPAIGSVDANGWKLVWSDEFNAAAIDPGKWNFEILKPRAYNNELQGYTNRNENARIENGNLLIETRKDNFQGQQYTSARMTTTGKGFWTYGRIEARIKLTSALGTWPAFWMMPEDQSKGWPVCGEIDILEQVGYEKDVIHGTTHVQKFFGGNGRGGPKTIANFTADYHIYSIEWFKDRIDWYVDGAKYFTQKNDGGDDVYPFHKPFHVILNFAIGGDWGGSKGVDTNMPNQRMLVDYVRVYQQK